MTGLILNSGTGSRMGDATRRAPKCMTPISETDTILSRQLTLLAHSGITNIVITTGAFDSEIQIYCDSLALPLSYTYVKNPEYAQTNYIYSICLAQEFLQDDLLLMHGDLVFEQCVLQDLLSQKSSCVTISTYFPLPEKDFKAVISNGKIEKIGIEFFDQAVAAQPLYQLRKHDWSIWLLEILQFCEKGDRSCYAENALNHITNSIDLLPFDFGSRLCAEIDTQEDLSRVKLALQKLSL